MISLFSGLAAKALPVAGMLGGKSLWLGAGLAAGFWLADMRADAGHASSLDKALSRVAESLALERRFALGREVTLWNEIEAGRQRSLELIDAYQKRAAAQDDAKARYDARVARLEAELQEQNTYTEMALDALKHAQSDFLDQPIPPDIGCRVLGQGKCPDPAYPDTGAGRP